MQDLGAEYNPQEKRYYISRFKLPPNILASVVEYEAKLKNMVDSIYSFLDNNIDNEIKEASFVGNYDEIVEDVNKQFKDSAKKAISIVPEITPEMEKGIAKDYTNNLQAIYQGFCR